MARYAEDVTEQALADVDVVDDDVCLLTLAYRQHPTFARELPAEPRRLTDLRRDLDTWLHAEGVVGADHEAVVLACSEAVNNAVEYAYPAERLGVVEVLAGVTPDEVQVRVRDWGEWRTARPPEDRGRGLAMIRSVMDEVSVDRSAGTVLSMRRTLRGGGGSPES
jgi:serine/threonine-protein kinase RsbW